MEDDRDAFTVFYQWKQSSKADNGEPVRSRIFLERRPCRFGGWRTFFICPSCGRRTLRLAVLPEGLLCGPCVVEAKGERVREGEWEYSINKAEYAPNVVGANPDRDWKTVTAEHQRRFCEK